MHQREAILLAANYGSNVGYAWNNILRMFNVLARALFDAGLDVCISFREAPVETSMFDSDLPIKFLRLDPRRIVGRNYFSIRETILRSNIRHVYLTDQRPLRIDYALLRLMGVRTIVIHNRVSVPDPRPAPPAHGIGGFAKSVANRLPLISADRVYAVSDFVAHRLIEYNRVPHNRVRKILNGINVDQWRCSAKSDACTVPTFFVAGRATRQKGVLTLVHAAAALRDLHGVVDFQVRFAGDGPDMRLLQDEVARLQLKSQFTFLGRLDDVRREVCRADIIVVPSEYGDACPSTVSEALASGRALIATEAGGIPELIGGPENALIVPPGDIDALATAMARLALEPDTRAALGINGVSQARARLTEHRYHQQVIASLFSDLGLDTAYKQGR